jgi:hypothetical protein
VDGPLLQPGALVTGKTEEKTLYLWRFCDHDDESAIPVNSDDLMIVIDAKTNEDESLLLSAEWKRGAYLVVASQGQKGWLGEGWVRSIT